MKPFRAWLAMNVAGRPALLNTTSGVLRYEAFMSDSDFRDERMASHRALESKRVLIIEDTKETRRKLGMEEA